MDNMPIVKDILNKHPEYGDTTPSSELDELFRERGGNNYDTVGRDAMRRDAEYNAACRVLFDEMVAALELTKKVDDAEGFAGVLNMDEQEQLEQTIKQATQLQQAIKEE